MKYVEFEGKQHKVPVWVKYIVRDSWGDVWGFENKPYKNATVTGGRWESDEGRSMVISETNSCWEDSLTEVD